MSSSSAADGVCTTCGSRIVTTASGDLGCLSCLLRTGAEDEPDSTAATSGMPESFGVYVIKRREDGSPHELGRGAMGVTFLAEDASLQRLVALKVIKTDVAQTGEDARERFMREARAAASLRHPNVATVYHFGIRQDTGQCYCAMELIEGETLEDRVHRSGPLDVGSVIEIARQIAAALAEAEKGKLVHRDLKPANIMILSPASEEAGPATPTAKIIDFGIAKALTETKDARALTQQGFIGTPAFASPEQFSGAPVDVRSDIYSLGATMWYLLSAHMPFGDTVRSGTGDEPAVAPPIEQMKTAHVPSAVTTLLRSMLAREPAARPSVRELTSRLENIHARLTDPRKTLRRLALAVAVLALAASGAFFVFHSTERGRNEPALAPAKSSAVFSFEDLSGASIAVLPFENLSEEKSNAYFAAGIQDEILTRLSKIGALKVIAGNSTAHYASKPPDVRQIAKDLDVVHLLEGSVQKSGTQVHVNVRLINAQSNFTLWADSFDRHLTDIFSVESEVAKVIADKLRAKLTGREEQVIAARPTNNPAAYDAYLRGLAYSRKTGLSAADQIAAQTYLKEAVRLDPKFALAWALLSQVDCVGYVMLLLQPTPALRDEARQAADTALDLQPNLAEALHAKGWYHYGCLKDYDTAARYFERARQLLPNNSQIPEALAYVSRRQGEWDRSEIYFNEAERLDPRNVSLLTQHAFSYIFQDRFAEALRKLDQALEITPNDPDTLAEKALIAQAEGDLPRAARLLAPLRPAADDPFALEVQVYQAILERQPARAIAQLNEILANPDPALGYLNAELRFWLGWAQELAGDDAAAQGTWRQARMELEVFLKGQSDNYVLIGDLALTCSGLGDKSGAFTLAERAMAATPTSKDAMDGSIPIDILARVAAQTGESDRAIAALEKVLSIPGAGAWVLTIPLTPALLRLDPMFDPLRHDPRFEKLAAAAASR